MEAFGRMITVAFSVVGLVFLVFFYRTSSVRWQKTETVRSLCHAYAERILDNKTVSYTEWKEFQTRLSLFGAYRAELAVYERKRFETENGRVYLFAEGGEAETVLSEGSYVRLLVTEERKADVVHFFYGAPATIIAGGRIA